MNYNMAINENLSLKGCWRMVNAIQGGRNTEDIRERCHIAEKWLKANKVISIEEYNDLMMTVSYLHRETYLIERRGY